MFDMNNNDVSNTGISPILKKISKLNLDADPNQNYILNNQFIENELATTEMFSNYNNDVSRNKVEEFSENSITSLVFSNASEHNESSIRSLKHKKAQAYNNPLPISFSDDLLNKDCYMNTTGLTNFKPSILTFRELSYTIQLTKLHWWNIKPPKPKQILDNVSGIFKPGVNAIMGPSGSGKTSLLTVLGGRKNLKVVEGVILVDGKPPSKTFTINTGFVTQEDLVMGTLTVRENIMFSASLRLPDTIGLSRKRAMVQDIINELNLNDCADQKVGTALIRGVSGGEKKRCNIGVELITHPSILFLDEPTTGLDAATAFTVVTLLKKLADKGCNIIMSIHQPRYDIFTLFDNLILLSAGQTVYHGLSNQSLHYFSTLGFVCEIHNNPADYYLDMIEKNSVRYVPDTPSDLNNNSNNITSSNGNDKDLQYTLRVNFAQKFKESNQYTQLIDELDEIEKNRPELKKMSFFKKHMINFGQQTLFPTTFCNQLNVVSSRSLKNLYRNPQPLLVQALTMLIYSFIVGSMYFKVSNNASFGLQNRRGAVFFLIMNQVFGNMSAIELFIPQKLLYIHETTNGFYRVSAFLFSKIFCDLIPMRIIPVLIVSLTAYWMVGLRPYPGNYFTFIVTLVCLTCAASSIAFCASCVFETIDVACNYCALYFVFQMVLGGLFVNLKSIALQLRWLKYLSIFRYAYSALLINEIKDAVYCNPPNLSTNGTALCISGNKYMEDQGIPFKTSWDLWSNHVALLLIMIIFWCLSYFQLRTLKSRAT